MVGFVEGAGDVAHLCPGVSIRFRGWGGTAVAEKERGGCYDPPGVAEWRRWVTCPLLGCSAGVLPDFLITRRLLAAFPIRKGSVKTKATF